MNSQENPEWMNDIAIQNIDPKKLEFLQKMVNESKGKSQKQMMMYFMSMMQKAKSENLAFTPEELTLLMTTVRKYSTKEELNKFDNFVKNKKF